MIGRRTRAKRVRKMQAALDSAFVGAHELVDLFGISKAKASRILAGTDPCPGGIWLYLTFITRWRHGTGYERLERGSNRTGA